jgi:hypothetical protein
MIWEKLWNMLRIVQTLNTVLNAEFIYLLILSVVDAAIKDSVLNLRKDFLTLMDSAIEDQPVSSMSWMNSIL